MSLLKVKGIKKAYRTYASEWLRVLSWFNIRTRAREEHWVLNGVSFDIQPGEAIGLVGQNGAGKSTLLKIITGTLQPSDGSVQVSGRIAAILELGMGFNPELTGRNNVLHAAGLMGFSRSQIEAEMANIEAFAEVGEYFDEPVRTYSSGMQMRVAFAVATAFRPDILIIDEALSVGDSYFQHKSFARIKEYQEQGTTLLLVSHDRASIQALCSRAILIDKGIALKDGSPEEVMDFYSALVAEKENSTIRTVERDDGKTQTTSGTGEATIDSVELRNAKGQPVEFIEVGEPVSLVVQVVVNSPIESLVLGYGIRDRLGQIIFGTNTWHTRQVIEHPCVQGRYEFRANFDAVLGVGSYSIQLALVDKDTHYTANYEWRDLALVFNVVNSTKDLFVGSSWIDSRIEVERI
ncbi:lipopolysaccharide transport system ATP-binding protein [Pseudomonas nitritireducens]|uniref:Lipopolysaccharide transport system ATP-binding protein n=1 Tax=Pseudomonas nitroreducens TaxID=46680 RepID=A0A7W7P124_PSENT|nr:ABC transporter ATP-binding protein [Pseudomonas nitritireducens]MBB4863000.1 lipopolysaccharide transport system ATP-binding protein [Pseudomonas nitritireducens]